LPPGGAVATLAQADQGGPVSATADVRTPSDELLLEVADAAAALYHLALRRAIWLGSAAEPDSPARAQIAGELDTQLQDAQHHAEVLLGVFDDYGPWCDERIAAALATGQFSEEGRAAFERVVRADGNYADRGAALASAFTAGIDDERAAVRAGLPERLDGFPLAFDAHDVGCGLVAFAAMGGMLTCPKTAGAGCALAGGCMLVVVAAC
jgi:hypothetical protein